MAGALQGVLVLKSSDGSVQALTVDAPPGRCRAAGGDSGAAAGDITLLARLAFRLPGRADPQCDALRAADPGDEGAGAGGHGGRHQSEAAREGFAYAAGAMLSFLVFGLVIVLLRQGGEAVGWGFQLQEPIAVAGFALLIFAVGLNLSGLFEVGTITRGRQPDAARRPRRRLLHRRAGGGGGRALHRALHGGGAGLCADPKRRFGAAGLLRRWGSASRCRS